MRSQSYWTLCNLLISQSLVSETKSTEDHFFLLAIHYIRKLENTKVFGDWELNFNDKILPQCAEHGNWTDMYIECFLRHITLSGYAYVGTCKMGALGDPTAVVDPILR